MKKEIYKKVEAIQKAAEIQINKEIEKLFDDKNVKAEIILTVENIPLDKMPENSIPEIRGTRKKYLYRGERECGFPILESVKIEGKVIFPDDPEYETCNMKPETSE